jgi:hypothetical protein
MKVLEMDWIQRYISTIRKYSTEMARVAGKDVRKPSPESVLAEGLHVNRRPEERQG